MTPLTQASQDSLLSIQGCGYRIEQDRVTLSIQQIANNRASDNISGTLQIQLCALSKQLGNTTEEVLASTTIGEIQGQHFIPNGSYDLLFQPPSAGTWQLILTLSEWDGVDYHVCDSVYFDVLYRSMNQGVIEESPDVEVTPDASLTSINQRPTKDTMTASQSILPSGGHLIINKYEAKKLLKVKVIPEKILKKMVLERPFHSEKAVLNIKGMGPKMLAKLLKALNA